MHWQKLKDILINLFNSFWISIWWFSLLPIIVHIILVLVTGMLSKVVGFYWDDQILFNAGNYLINSPLIILTLYLWLSGSIISFSLLFITYQFEKLNLNSVIIGIFISGIVIGFPMLLFLGQQ